jgi:RNA polymerase sigma factor (sigma-70 family)
LKDTQIIQAILSGKDDSVLKELYSVVLPKVKRFILGNNGSNDDAKDIFQEAVLLFYKQVKLGKFNDTYEISGYIFTIGKNLWIDQARKNKNRHFSQVDDLSLVEYNNTPIDMIMNTERSNLLSKALDYLGEHCKTLLTYSVYDHISMKEIAEKMNYASENAAKTANYKCKQRLIQILKNNKVYSELI